MLKHLIILFKKFFSLQNLTSDRSINAAKTCIACAIGYALIKIFNLEMGQWILISIVVVMSAQAYIGGAIQKAYMRVLGTLIGALVGGVTLYFFPHTEVILVVVVLLSCLGFAYMAGGDNGGAGTLGAATVIMILMATPLKFETAFIRPLEILLGIVIAIAVSRVIFPIRAAGKLKTNLANSLDELKKLYQHMQHHHKTEEGAMHISTALEEKLLNLFASQKKLLDESKAEHYGKGTHKLLRDTMRAERQVYRGLLLLNYALHNNPHSTSLILALKSYQVLNAEVLAAFAQLSKALVNKKFVLKTSEFSLEKLKAEIKITAARSPFEDEIYVEAFLVSAEFLAKEIRNLEVLVSKF